MSKETVTIEKDLYERLTFQLENVVTDALAPAMEEMVKVGELESARLYGAAAIQLIDLVKELRQAKEKQDEEERDGLPF